MQRRHWAIQYVRRGVRYAKEGQYPSAIEQYDAALQNAYDYADAFVARGAAKANMVRITTSNYRVCHNVQKPMFKNFD